MTLTYIFHSGFVLETERCILVFDFWMDPARVMPDVLKRGKPLYVFASHFHEDHFNREIFSWREQTADIKFILSKDILKRRRTTAEQADVWMAKGQTWQDERIRVTAAGSNDCGVSWIVEVDGKKVFHAGDLNNWFARFLAERDVVPETIVTDEGKEVNPVYEEKRFLGELKDIAKITSSFDLTMFPVDGRIGNGYTLGGRQFIDCFRVGLFVPMHFVVSGFESAWRMAEYCEERGVGFWKIGKEGETIEIENENEEQA